jgi:hypothetical protein
MVGGTVPVCDDLAREEDWPDGAREWVAQDVAAVVDELRGERPRQN